MAQCVEVNWIPLSDGSNAVVLSPSEVPAADCLGGLLVSPAELSELQGLTARVQALEAAPSSTDLPPSDELAAAWGASFVLVVGCYVVGRVVGVVVNFIK